MSATSVRSSGVPNALTGGAMRSRRGSPIFRIVRTVIGPFLEAPPPPRAAPAPARSARPRRRSGTRRSALRMEEADVVAGRAGADAARREAHAVRRSSQATAAGRSSIHRPMWLSGVAWTAGLPSGSIGSIRSTSTRVGPLPRAQMSSSTFSRSLRKLPVTSRPSMSTQSVRSAALLRPPMRDLLDAEHLRTDDRSPAVLTSPPLRSRTRG